MAVYEINVQKAFTAAHSLLLSDGTAEPSHSHDWCVTATFRADQLDEAMGVVIDFLAVDAALDTICTPLDQSDLNALPAFGDGRASAERIAELLAGLLAAELSDELATPPSPGPRLHSLNVTEAPGCSATFYPNTSET